MRQLIERLLGTGGVLAEGAATAVDSGDQADAKPIEHAGGSCVDVWRNGGLHATAERQHQTLCERLSDEVPAGCAQSHAHGELPAPGIGAREQQVRKVDARDQQHAPDRREEH